MRTLWTWTYAAATLANKARTSQIAWSACYPKKFTINQEIHEWTPLVVFINTILLEQRKFGWLNSEYERMQLLHYQKFHIGAAVFVIRFWSASKKNVDELNNQIIKVT